VPNTAKRSEVLLHISKIDRAIRLVIGDNGQGFDPSETHLRDGRTRGQGLVGMRERVELSGGSFAIESSIGKGTVIRASWPASPQRGIAATKSEARNPKSETN